MGTHGTFGITWASGKHECVEHSLDGQDLPVFIKKLFEKAPLMELDLLSLPTNFGNGKVMFTAEREHEQEYFFHINFKTKTLEMTMFGTDPEKPIVVEWLGEVPYKLLKKKGWKFQYAADCCEMHYVDPEGKYVCNCEGCKAIRANV